MTRHTTRTIVGGGSIAVPLGIEVAGTGSVERAPDDTARLLRERKGHWTEHTIQKGRKRWA